MSKDRLPLTQLTATTRSSRSAVFPDPSSPLGWSNCPVRVVVELSASVPFDRCLPLPLHHRKDGRRRFGLQLRRSRRTEHHVRCAVLYHSRTLARSPPWYGDGIAAALNRIFGAMAPIIGIYAGGTSPLYVAASLFLVAGVLSFFIPLESRGRSAL